MSGQGEGFVVVAARPMHRGQADGSMVDGLNCQKSGSERLAF